MEREGIWCLHDFGPIMIRSTPEGWFLDWAEKPFQGECAGLAWDGQNLWALDAKEQRLCVIERVPRADRTCF